MICFKNIVRYFYIVMIALAASASLQAMSKEPAPAKHARAESSILSCMSSPVSPREELDKEVDKSAREVDKALALINLGASLEKRDEKEADNCYKVALKILRPLAIVGQFPAAQRVLGMCHEFGKGVKPSMENALMYYNMAAKRGDRGACQRLADIYENGLGGVEKNEPLACFWKIMS